MKNTRLLREKMLSGDVTTGIMGAEHVRLMVLSVLGTMYLLSGCAAYGGELDLRPIISEPEPLNHSQMHPKLKWMVEQKIRAIWIGDDLFEQYPGSDKTKGQVLADAGFNLVRIGMTVNSDNTRSGVVDTSKPYELKHDRSKSIALETRLAPNIKEARRLGLTLMIGFQYGTHHLEPYRKYRSTTDGLAQYTCCPIEETYITGQHVGKWAVKLAEGGADGMVIDMEMYHSDKANYYWPDQASCVCDECFKIYLKTHAGDSEAIFKKVPAEGRAQWLTDQGAEEHYRAYAAQRIEAMYDSIRARCQKINPAFFFGVAPGWLHLPGVERGLGTTSVPCLVFSEHEYHHGPYRGSFVNTKRIRETMPALFLCGAYVAVQTPDEMAGNMVQSSLYCDGWWPWYGTALLKDDLPGDYGRVEGTSAGDYLDLIAATHARIDKLLNSPQNQWPARRDGKLRWLKAKVAKAEAESDAAKTKSDEAAKALAEVNKNLENYLAWPGPEWQAHW